MEKSYFLWFFDYFIFGSCKNGKILMKNGKVVKMFVNKIVEIFSGLSHTNAIPHKPEKLKVINQ